MTGRAVFGSMPFGNLLSIGLGTEIIYSFVIIVCSLIIYFGTKELYELSSYKGIKYFRQSFLFFAIAYFFRSFIKFALVYFDVVRILDVSPRVFGLIFGRLTLFVFMYFSSMAVFYLLYSLMFKKWENKNRTYLFHLLAFLISFVIIISGSSLIYLMINLFLFIFAAFIGYNSYRNSENKAKGHNLYFIYILLFIFWILNILDILIPNFFQTFQLFIYLVSLGIFLTILYKVIRKAGD